MFMRKYLAFVFYCFAGAVLACDDAKVESAEEWFRQPEVTVDGTSADVVCLTLFGEGALSASTCGFVYQPVATASTSTGLVVSDPQIEGSLLRCRLSDLTPETTYLVYPFVEIGGNRMSGKPADFRSGTKSEEPDPENPDPEHPDPENPDPQNPTLRIPLPRTRSRKNPSRTFLPPPAIRMRPAMRAGPSC